MSIRVMTQVWEHSEAKGSELLLLLAISDFADDNGIAWPSIDTLAKKTRLSIRQVQRQVRKLEEMEELKVTPQAARHGVNLYQVLMGDKMTGVTPKTRRGDTGDAWGDTGDVEGVTPMTPEPSVEPSIEPPRNHQSLSSDFDLFWSIYPNKTEKKKAQEMWSKIKPDDDLVWDIIAAVREHQGSKKWQDGYVKAAFRWLRDENWKDEITPYTNGKGERPKPAYFDNKGGYTAEGLAAKARGEI